MGIFESNAIARYIAKIRRDTGLTGNGSLVEEAIVDSWIGFSANNLELPACVWWYPTAGFMPFQKAAYEKAKTDLAAGLTILNNHLLDKTYLVNDQITLADITVVSALLYPMKLVCDKNFLKPFTNVVRWFTTCVNQKEFKDVVGAVQLCKKETTAPGQEAPKNDNKGGGGGKRRNIHTKLWIKKHHPNFRWMHGRKHILTGVIMRSPWLHSGRFMILRDIHCGSRTIITTRIINVSL